MHASNLLKAVLKPRVSSNSGKKESLASQQNDTVARGKAFSSPDNVLPSATIVAKKSVLSSASSPKMTCLCSPSKHPGSFRCRLHRAQEQAGGTRLPSTSNAARSSTVPVPETFKPVIREKIVKRSSFPPPLPPAGARSPPRTSRLNRMVISAQATEMDANLTTQEGQASKTRPGSGGSFSSSLVGGSSALRSADFSLDLYCQSTSKQAIDVFDRNMTRMYL